MGKTILVYGGDLPAVSAAAKAAATAMTETIHLIVPYVPHKLGGIATVGGQNYWDYVSPLTQQGTFGWLIGFGIGYNTDDLAAELLKSLNKYSNIQIHWGYDICDYTTVSNPYRITSVTIKPLCLDADKRVNWGSGAVQTLTADIFIDASVEGRLARMVNSACTTGRHCWPNLPAGEVAGKVAKQAAATLMVKLKGIDHTKSGSGFYYSQDPASGAWSCWGGSVEYKDSGSKIAAFNKKYASQGYMIKPVNAAQNGKNLDEWWANTFLIFDVDGRANHRDKGTRFYPTMLAGTKNVDDAWVDAHQFLKDKKDEVLGALREFPGFVNADFVTDSAGYPEVGDVLYIRETVHMARSSTYTGADDENQNYHVGATAALRAGASSGDGADSIYYAHRIGLAHYNADIHPYAPSDCQNGQEWIWGYDSFRKMRPDMNIGNSDPVHPVYLPYEALLTHYVSNLLLPGYAANVSSFAWGEVRVLCNLCVLGDAAGIAAAYCVINNLQPLYLNDSQIADIQALLRTVDAKLDK